MDNVWRKGGSSSEIIFSDRKKNINVLQRTCLVQFYLKWITNIFSIFLKIPLWCSNHLVSNWNNMNMIYFFFRQIGLNICNADRSPYISYNWIGHEKWTMYAISKATNVDQSLFKRTQSNNIRVDYLSIFRPPTVLQ